MLVQCKLSTVRNLPILDRIDSCIIKEHSIVVNIFIAKKCLFYAISHLKR